MLSIWLGNVDALRGFDPLGSRGRKQLPQPDQIIGGRRKGEGEAHPVAASKLRPLLPGDRLDPAETSSIRLQMRWLSP